MAKLFDMMREAYKAAQAENTRSPASFAWGYLAGFCCRSEEGGAKAIDVVQLLRFMNDSEDEPSIHETMKAVGRCVVQLIQDIPASYLDNEQDEAVEELATRLVVSASQHGLVIMARPTYDRMTRQLADAARHRGGT